SRLRARVRQEVGMRTPAATDSCRVMAGLDPQVGFTRLAALKSCGTRASPSSGAIHPLRKSFLRRTMDPRVKPAGDARGQGAVGSRTDRAIIRPITSLRPAAR